MRQRRTLYDHLRDRAARWLRIPPPPAVPAGTPGSVRRFRAAPGFYRYRQLQWGLKQLGALWGLVAGFAFIGNVPERFPFSEHLHWLEIGGVALFVLQLPLGFFLVRFDFENRWYLVTDRSLRIREGVLKVHEQTMSFANLQNLSIRQGPLQRLLGIADLQVRTAGGGGKGESGKGDEDERNLHLAFFRGVSNAEEIRDLILAHLRKVRGTGLGDPDEADVEASAAPGSTDSDALTAARELLAEATRLRASLRPGDHAPR